MAEPILQTSALNNKKILSRAAREYTTGNTLAWAMGAGETSIIHTIVDTSKGIGDNIQFPFLQKLDPDNARIGNQQVSGTEEDLVYRDDRVIMEEVNHAAKLERRRMVNLRTPLAVFEALRPSIITAAAERLRNDIIDAAKLTSTSSPVRSRVLFGNDDANYNATLATGLGAVDNTTDKMSVAVIRKARMKALGVKQASNGEKERKIRPFRVQMDNGALVETFVLLLDSVAADQLRKDAEYTDLRDDQRTNAISMPFFNASKFLGDVAGVMVYEVEDLDRLTQAGAGAAGIDVSHSLLCGAQAWGMGIAQTGRFFEEARDYQKHVGVNYEIIRGIKVLKFQNNSGAEVENGIVHIFTSGVLA